jgi:hypothetical protein
VSFDLTSAWRSKTASVAQATVFQGPIGLSIVGRWVYFRVLDQHGKDIVEGGERAARN